MIRPLITLPFYITPANELSFLIASVIKRLNGKIVPELHMKIKQKDTQTYDIICHKAPFFITFHVMVCKAGPCANVFTSQTTFGKIV